jgi:hypothetical protein
MKCVTIATPMHILNGASNRWIITAKDLWEGGPSTIDTKECMLVVDGSIMEIDTPENDTQMKDFMTPDTTERDILRILEMVVVNIALIVVDYILLVHPEGLVLLIPDLLIPMSVAQSRIEISIFDADTRVIMETDTKVRANGARIEVILETTDIVVVSLIPRGTMVIGLAIMTIAENDSMMIAIAVGKGTLI